MVARAPLDLVVRDTFGLQSHLQVLIEVIDALTGMLLVCFKIEVRAMRNSFELAVIRRGERVAVFDVGRSNAFFRIMAQLVAVVLPEAQVRSAHAEGSPPFHPLVLPEVEP